jgi:hypothetical protein
VRIRAAEPADAPAVTAIYNEGIAGREATFETRPREPDEVAALAAWTANGAIVSRSSGCWVRRRGSFHRMHTLLRLPLILLEMALRQGAGAVKDILRLVTGGAEDAERGYAPDPMAARREAETVAAEEARARRPEARPRAAARRRPAPTPPAPAPAPSVEAELLGEQPAHVTTGAETVASFGPADDPSPTFDVQAPWDGYDKHSAAEIVKRLRATDEATRAVALLYERGHKGRSSVIRAAGGQRATA